MIFQISKRNLKWALHCIECSTLDGKDDYIALLKKMLLEFDSDKKVFTGKHSMYCLEFDIKREQVIYIRDAILQRINVIEIILSNEDLIETEFGEDVNICAYLSLLAKMIDAILQEDESR